MDNFRDRRKVIGSTQLRPGEKIISTREYARRYSYSISQVARRCRQKKLRAYKNAGNWLIVVSD